MAGCIVKNQQRTKRTKRPKASRWIDLPGVCLDTPMRWGKPRHRGNRPNLKALEQLAQLRCAFITPVATVGNDHRGLSELIPILMVQGISL